MLFCMSEMTLNQDVPAFSPVSSVDYELEEMMKAGVHMGHAKSKNHPAMQPYIYGVRNTISIIDLTKTKEKLVQALKFIRETVSRGGAVLLVGTRPAARGVISDVAAKTGMPYFTERWIGGTLTNFKVISQRVEYMERLEKEKTSGEFEKYTKKERMKKEEEIVRLKKNFLGLRNLKKPPSVLFVVDINHDDTAIREANRMKIPIVASVDTNSNADLVGWPIPSNDDALPSVRYMVERIGGAIEEGLKEQKTQNTETHHDNSTTN